EDQVQPDGGMPGDLDRQGREADHKAGDLHDEGGGAVAGLDRGEVIAAGFTEGADLEEALEQRPLAAGGATAAQARADRLSAMQIGAGLFVPRRLKCRAWIAQRQPKVT